jgi:hypothetical protein
MIKEGLRESANLDEPRISTAEQNLDVKADLLRTIEILSYRLKQLEREAANKSGKSGSFEAAKDENGCSYMSTCYAAKMGTDSCPCELRR